MVFRKKKDKEKDIQKGKVIETNTKQEETKTEIPQEIKEMVDYYNEQYAPIFSPNQFVISSSEYTKISILFGLLAEAKKTNELLEEILKSE